MRIKDERSFERMDTDEDIIMKSNIEGWHPEAVCIDSKPVLLNKPPLDPSQPPAVNAMHSIIRDMGIEEYEPQIALHLLEVAKIIEVGLLARTWKFLMVICA
eukprot:Platyproteum_vivax@DN14527_c0_g1_i1.p1